MLLRRITSEGVSHHSYFVADGGEALVVDPRRDIDVYLDLAAQEGLRIRSVLETHRNEDYVIGSRALQDATGAQVLHSEHLDFGYGETVKEGDTLGLGRLRVRVLETPGHTDDSLTFALSDLRDSEDPVIAFTGDALFIGDTGRTDLLDDAERAAAELHRSLFEKILPLGDGVVLCPAHGGGSVCGGAISDRDLSSLGFERLHNPGLQHRDRESFVRAKLGEPHLQPPYFKRMEDWNQSGPPVYERLPLPPPLSPGELAERVQDGAVVVDARMPQAFAGGHIPGAYSIWRSGLSAYLGWIVPVGTPVLLVLPEEASVEAATRVLLRIGYDEMAGVLRGGFETWQNEGRPVARHGTIDTETLRNRLARGGDDLAVVDVRKPSEWEGGTIEGAHRIFVGDLERRAGELPRDRILVSMCSVGHRGALGASILERHGFPRVLNYLGGYTAWKQTANG